MAGANNLNAVIEYKQQDRSTDQIIPVNNLFASEFLKILTILLPAFVSFLVGRGREKPLLPLISGCFSIFQINHLG